MNISILGGKNEIGGNKILVEDKEGKIFLDFGQSFNKLDDYFVNFSYLFPRTRFGLRDFFEFDLIPKIKGLYNKSAIEHTDIEFGPAEYDGVFITHAHFDHVAHLKYLHPEIPVFMGESTKKILQSSEKTTAYPTNTTSMLKVNTFTSGKEIECGGMKVTPIHVDHSVPGAYGYIIETSEGTIAYSGDLRAHGPRADMTEEFLKKAEGSDVFIIEGTRVAPKKKDNRSYMSEAEVRSKCEEVVSNASDAIVTSRYPKDLDRFRTFYDIAKKSGKELIISIKTAHLLKALSGDQHLKLPDPLSDENIKIYGRRKKIYYEWERELITKCVNSKYVARRQNECILEIDFYTLTELIDIKPDGGDFIHSMSEPFQEDPLSQLSDVVLQNWLNHFNLKRYQLHASGHASMEEIFGMIEGVGAKKIHPIHTEHEELFSNEGL